MWVATEQLRFVADRLRRLLAAGWRNAELDVARLGDAVPALEQLGFVELAGRVRGVVDSRPEDRLATITTARLVCQLLQARLQDDAAPPGSWEPLTARTRSGAFDRLVTIGRLALADREAWACVRVKGFKMDLLLVEPPVDADWGSARPGRPVSGRIRWIARYPLGVGGDVPLVALEGYQWVPVENDEGRAEPLTHPWTSLDLTKLEDGQHVLADWGHLQVKRLGPDDAEGCAWPDPATREAFRSAALEPVWTVAWVDGPLVTPLAIVKPPGFLSPARLIHLTVGNPSDRLET